MLCAQETTGTCNDDPAAMRTLDSSTMRYVSSTRGRGMLSPKNTTLGLIVTRERQHGGEAKRENNKMRPHRQPGGVLYKQRAYQQRVNACVRTPVRILFSSRRQLTKQKKRTPRAIAHY